MMIDESVTMSTSTTKTNMVIEAIFGHGLAELSKQR